MGVVLYRLSNNSFDYNHYENTEYHLEINCNENGINVSKTKSDNDYKVAKPLVNKPIDSGTKVYESLFLKAPYIIYPGNGYRIKINWQLNDTDTCLIRWGQEPNIFIDSLVTLENDSNNLMHIHSVILDSLVPNTKYYYKIKTNWTVREGSFISPQDSNSLNTSFYALGDSRSAIKNLDSIAAQINSEVSKDTHSQTFIMHTGDWTTSGSEDEWQNEVFNINYNHIVELLSKMPIQGVRGNHENYFNAQASVYQKYWTYSYEMRENGLYYSFDYGPIHFSIIDQYSPYDSNSIQYNWLKNDLLNTQKPWKIIAFHEPGYSDGNHLDNIHVQNRIQPLCEEYHVTLVLAGHNHYYAHNLINGVNHLTLGGGGSPLYNPLGTGQGLIKSEKSFHFAKIEVDSAILTVSIIRPDGSYIEKFNVINNTPVFKSNPILDVIEDSIYRYEVTCTDLEKQRLEILNDSIPTWMNLIDNGDGTALLTGKPSNSDVGIHHITLSVSDQLSTAYQKFDIEVINSNDAPEFISEPKTETFEDSLFTYLVNCRDEDGDKLKITALLLPTWLSFEDYGNGSAKIEGIPSNTEVGLNTISLSVEDKDTLINQRFELWVLNVNDIPEFVSIPLCDAFEDSLFIYLVNCFDEDGDKLKISSPIIPDWLSIQDNGDGTAVLSGIPSNDNVGNQLINLLVSDSISSNTQSFKLNVINTNDFPEFVSKPIEEVYDDTIYRYQIQCLDVDNDSLMIVANDIPFWLKLENLGSGKAALFGFPGSENIGIDSIVIYVSDGIAAVNQEFEISVIARLALNEIVKNKYTIFPNPVHDYIEINIDAEVIDNIDCIIYNMEGRLVYSAYNLKVSNHVLQFNVSGLENGLYILYLKSNNTKFSFRFFKSL